MLANTIHAYPVLLIGGWFGVVTSMGLEMSSYYGYLRRIRPTPWIIRRFVIANVLSAVVGLFCYIVLKYYPSGSPEENVRSLITGVGLAFVLTIAIELGVFVMKTPGKELPVVIRAVFMSNFFSYALLVGLHLFSLR